MKTFYFTRIFLTIFLTLSFTTIHSQISNININDVTGNREELTLKTGSYELIISGNYDCDSHKIIVTKEETIEVLPPIEELIGIETSICSYYKKIDLPLQDRSKITVTVSIVDSDDKEVKKFVRIISAIKNKTWITSLGVASSILLQTDTYRTVENTDGTFTIREGGSQNIFRPIPLMQFSYIDLRKDWGFAPSGGIGFDLENISVFGGVSLYFGQNFIVTTGLAFHKQLRLKNDYLPNEVVSSTIAFDDLNVDYYRINPFISLTFRLDKNPFKN